MIRFIFLLTVMVPYFSIASAGLISKLPEPVRLKKIDIPPYLTPDQEPISYTDCVEINLLRFIQAITIDLERPQFVDINILKRLGASEWILEFFSQHTEIQSKDFFSDSTSGHRIRTQWALLLTGLPSRSIVYVRERKFELEARIVNFFEVLNLAFPRLGAIISPGQTTFDHVANFFSRPGLVLSLELKRHSSTGVEDLLYRETIFDILFNGVRTYEWKLYEYIDASKTHTLTGHSELTDLRPPQTPPDLSDAHFPSPIIFKKVIIPAQVAKTEAPVEYTDCVETTFLRILQVLFSDLNNPIRIDLERLNQATQNPILFGFLSKHSTIERNAFYFKTEEGQALRTEWAICLSRNNLIYNKGEFEVRATLKNVFSLFHLFSPKINLRPDIPLVGDVALYQAELNKVATHFSFPGFMIEMKIVEHVDIPLGDALQNRVTLVDVFVNKRYCYQWNVHEFLQNNVRVTGHAELYHRFRK